MTSRHRRWALAIQLASRIMKSDIRSLFNSSGLPIDVMKASGVACLSERLRPPARCLQPAPLSTPNGTVTVPRPVITDLTVCTFSPTAHPSICNPDPRTWHRIEKDLHLHSSKQSAWVYIAMANEDELTAEDLLVKDIRVGEPPPYLNSKCSWESRPGGIWVLRSQFSGNIDQAVTEVDVLFGDDAVDPRPQWTLIPSSLHLINRQLKIPVAKLSVLHGRAKPRSDARTALRVKEDGKFRIVQISDTHMVAGVGFCNDAIDANGKHLPESEADPLTVDFIRKILDVEKPDLVIFTGDQLHHDIPDSQSALFKVFAPIIERSIPFAAVFGNHDTEGAYALSRTAQMSLLQDLPFSHCEPGPKQVDGIGNFDLQILAPSPSQLPLATLYFLDSHGQISSKMRNPDYDAIKQSQIDWFENRIRAQKTVVEGCGHNNRLHLSLVFLHIPLPEFGDRRLQIRQGQRREPTESPSYNSHFYDALVRGGVSAIGCGHDHVNDFCGLLPHLRPHGGDENPQLGPWLCYGGGSGFGGYCSYGRKRFHRRMRVWELDTSTGSLKTWKRVEYAMDRVDEQVLVENGEVVDSSGEENTGSTCVVS